MKLIQCQKCNKIFKITNIINNIYYTDLGGRFVIEDNKSICLCCGNHSIFKIIEIEDWVADRVFNTKGK